MFKLFKSGFQYHQTSSGAASIIGSCWYSAFPKARSANRALLSSSKGTEFPYHTLNCDFPLKLKIALNPFAVLWFSDIANLHISIQAAFEKITLLLYFIMRGATQT